MVNETLLPPPPLQVSVVGPAEVRPDVGYAYRARVDLCGEDQQDDLRDMDLQVQWRYVQWCP